MMAAGRPARFELLILYLAVTGLLVAMLAAFLPSMKRIDSLQPS
jgi:hypothetical protein